MSNFDVATCYQFKAFLGYSGAAPPLRTCQGDEACEHSLRNSKENVQRAILVFKNFYGVGLAKTVSKLGITKDVDNLDKTLPLAPSLIHVNSMPSLYV